MIVLNWGAIFAAVAAAFVFGGLWYGPLFGRVWGKAIGMPMDKKPEKGVMIRAFSIQAVGIFLTSYVMTHSLQVWFPTAWGHAEDGGSPSMFAVMSAFFTWLGFYVPLQANKVAWELRPWKVFFINTGHDFLNLLIINLILANWR
jgi:hypothetical protein